MAFKGSVRTHVRQWLTHFSLLGLPALLYWPGLWMRYGFRDDYSTLREAVEEPGKLFWFTCTAGRPVYGLFLEPSFRLLDGIDDLGWWRLGGALWIGLAAALFRWILERRQGWAPLEAWCAAALFALLPSAQILIGWAICWPHTMAVATAFAAFAVNDWGLGLAQGRRRILACTAGASLLVAAILSYQPSGLCYVVPVASGALAACAWREPRRRIEWLVRHIAFVVLGLVAAFAVTKAIFLFGIAEAARRVVIETDWLGKLAWLLRTPLDNALGIFVLENDLDPASHWHRTVAVLVSVAAVLGGLVEGRRRGAAAAVLWFGAGAALALLGYAVSLVAVERWPTYRTMYALSGVVIVYLVRAIAVAGADVAGSWRARASSASLVLLCLLGAWHARHSFVAWHAEPQAAELWRLEEAAARLDPDTQSRVYVILPHPKQSWVELRYLDEFGSLSADSEWCAKEMLRLLLRERFPDQPALVQRIEFVFGSSPPPAAAAGYDAVIDLRFGLRRS